ncbi:MAG: hypothetical protein WCK93_02530 [Nitrosomonadales bacterium]
MQMKTYFLASVILTSLAGNSVLADYSSSEVGVSRYYRPNASDECSKLKPDEVDHACDAGVVEGTRLAEHWGTANGFKEGYLKGYARGLNQTALAHQQDASQIQAGAGQVNQASRFSQYMQSARDMGATQGTSDGNTAGASEASARFWGAVGKGQLPSQQVAIHQTHYLGVDNGYRTHGPAIVKTSQQILQQDMTSLDRLDPYSSWDNVYAERDGNMHIWQYWAVDGSYNYDSSRWTYGSRESEDWNMWQRRGDRSGVYARYRDPLKVADGKDDKGNPKFKSINLQDAFERGFKKAYRDYIAYYFSQGAYQGYEHGLNYGNIVGTQLGQKIAQQSGMIQEFDRQFKAESVAAYSGAYANTYRQSFETTYADYATHPKLSARVDSVIGKSDDGILSPGEPVSLIFTLTNTGGVAPDNVTVTLDGNLVQLVEEKLPVIGRLAARQYKTRILGTIDPALLTRASASIDLMVNGVRTSHTENVFNQIGLNGVQNQIDILRGAGSVAITLANLSTVHSAGLVTVNLDIGSVAAKGNAGSLAGHEGKTVTLNIAGLDPLTLITSGLTGNIQLMMNNHLQESGSLVVKSDNTAADLVRYFDQLATGNGFIGSAASLDARIGEVAAKIMEINHGEVSRDFEGNPWADTPPGSILANVVATYKATPQTPASAAYYDALGQRFWEDRTNLGRFIFKSSARNAYEELTKTLLLSKPKH